MSARFVTVTPGRLRVLIRALDAHQAAIGFKSRSTYAVLRSVGEKAYETFSVVVDTEGAEVAQKLGFTPSSNWAELPSKVEYARRVQVEREGEIADLIESLSVPGTTVVLEPRTYEVTTTILMGSANTTLQGSVGTVLRAADGLDVAMMRMTGDNQSLLGPIGGRLIFDGNFPGRTAQWAIRTVGQTAHCLTMRSCTNFTIARVRMGDANDPDMGSIADGFYLGRVDDTVDENGFRIGPDTGTITDCEVYYSRRQAMAITAARNTTITRFEGSYALNDVDGATASGIDTEPNPLELISNITVVDLVARGNSGNGIRIGAQGIGCRIEDFTVTGDNCLLLDNQSRGYQIDCGADVQGVDNTVLQPSDLVSGWIELDDNDTGLLIKCSQNAPSALLTNVYIRRARVRNTLSRGVLIETPIASPNVTNVSGVSMIECDIRYSGSDDIFVRNVDSFTATDNTISKSAITYRELTPNLVETGTITNAP